MSDEVIVPEVIGKKKRGRPKGQKDSKPAQVRKKVSKVLDLKARGLSIAEIAGASGLSLTRTKDILREFRPVFNSLDHLEQYQNVRRDLLSATELELLKSLNDKEKISKSTLNGAAYAFKQVFDARRIESGLSTQNISQQVVKVSMKPNTYEE
jgi:transcriptional regulator with XRE-family HTH domain